MKKSLLSFMAAAMLSAPLAMADGYPTTVVVEEGTGNWCGFCVRGIVALEQASNKYPDSFIGIAVHDDSNTYPYDYTCSDYIKGMKLSGYPQCNVQRTRLKSDISPSGINTLYSTFHALQAAGKVSSMSATLSEDGQSIEFSADCEFIADATQMYNIAFVLLEDGLPGLQANYYSGGGYGAMGGFETMTNPCQVTYNDVARGIYPEYVGMELTDGVEAGEVYTATYTANNPKYANPDKLRAVALLLAYPSGRITNALQCPVKSETGIVAVAADSAEPVATEFYTIDGRRVAAPGAGMYIRVDRMADGSTRVEKSLRK